MLASHLAHPPAVHPAYILFLFIYAPNCLELASVMQVLILVVPMQTDTLDVGVRLNQNMEVRGLD